MRKIIFCLVVLWAFQQNAVGVNAVFYLDSMQLNALDSVQAQDTIVKSKNDTNSRVIGLGIAEVRDTISSGQIDSLMQSVRDNQERDSDKNKIIDTSLVIQKKQKYPKMAGLLSAMLPGAGQVYNKSYWKLAVIYGGAYLLVRNMVLYNKTQEFYHGALIIHNQDTTSEVITSDLTNYVDTYKNVEDYTDWTGESFATLDAGEIKLRFEDYRSNLENLYVFSVVLYGLNILDAVVDAHLKSFDVSDDLSMKVTPSVLNLSGTYRGLGPAISVKFSLK